MQATLLFGIGAAKAGTTWLYRYLAEHPDCAMSEPKELHYFDVAEFGGRERVLGRALETIMTLSTRIEDAPRPFRRRLKVRREALMDYAALLLDDEMDDARYLDFMRKLAGSSPLVGDITPAYGLLPASRLARMAALGPATRFVYLMRDPIERLWSNLREMAAASARTVSDARLVVRGLLADVLEGRDSPALARGDYADAFGRIDAGIPSGQIHFEFYERLFQASSLARLCAFLGIGARPAKYGMRVRGGLPMELGESDRAGLRRILAPQYAVVADRFGGDLPPTWSENMIKV